MAKAASRARAWIGTLIFHFLAPGVVAGLVPWLFSDWRWYDWGGAAWVVVPIAPTQALVVTGIYRSNVPGWWPRLTPWRGRRQ